MQGIEIIAIGDEVLAGFTINGNAAAISRSLSRRGFHVTSHRTLPDEADHLKRGLIEALANNSLVICTGGLGPTLDDRTRQIVADHLGDTFIFCDEVYQKLLARGYEDGEPLRDQATIPASATPLHNSVGTAPGLIFDQGDKVLILLPGVPLEMDPMFHEQVLPFLADRFPPPPQEKVRVIHFAQVREVIIDEKLRELAEAYPQVKFGIYPGPALVTVRFFSKEKQALDAIEKSFLEAFGEASFPAENLEETIHTHFVDHNLTLAVAESCTGGGLASILVSHPGASDYFLGGVVAYSNEVKQNILGVKEETLIAHGAVSEEVVREMAEGTRRAMSSDYAIATSGIAGPDGGGPEKPVGMVCVGIAGPKGVRATTLQVKGNRAAVIAQSINQALAELYKEVR